MMQGRTVETSGDAESKDWDVSTHECDARISDIIPVTFDRAAIAPAEAPGIIYPSRERRNAGNQRLPISLRESVRTAKMRAGCLEGGGGAGTFGRTL